MKFMLFILYLQFFSPGTFVFIVNYNLFYYLFIYFVVVVQNKNLRKESRKICFDGWRFASLLSYPIEVTDIEQWHYNGFQLYPANKYNVREA